MTVESVAAAWNVVASLDDQFVDIVELSLLISMAATIVAASVGLPVAAWLAQGRGRGSASFVLCANACLGLPPVVVGLALYLLLSRIGPLGSAGLLFTPAAMVVAQTTLAFPIVIAVAQQALREHFHRFGGAIRVQGAGRFRAILPLLGIGHRAAVTATLAAFGRAISEVGAILIVGGNIAGETRTMTTAIALETSRGNFPLALALGGVLIAISLSVSLIAYAIAPSRSHHA